MQRWTQLFLSAALVASPAFADGTTPGSTTPDPATQAAALASAQAKATSDKAAAVKAQEDVYASLVTAAGTRSALTVATGAGALEAGALGADSLKAVADRITPQVAIAYGTADPGTKPPAYCISAPQAKSVFFVTDPWKVDTSTIDFVEPQLTNREALISALHGRAGAVQALIKRQLDVADKSPRPKDVLSPAGGIAPAVLIAGASILTAALKQDVDIYNVTLTSGDSMLLRTTAGAYRAANPGVPIYLPALYSPSRGEAKAILARFAKLDQSLTTLLDDQAKLNDLAARATAGDAGDKTPLSLKYASIGKALSALRAPLDAFITAQQAWMSAALDQSKGQSLAQQAAAQADLGCIAADGGIVAQVKSEVFGGSIYTKKSLWTSINGSIPIYISAGSVASFAYVDLQNARFINAGAVKQVGEFQALVDAGDRGHAGLINGFASPPPPAGR